MTNEYNKPDFLVVGAAKSGTTSLFHYLNQHPDIYIPSIKECRFFSQMPRNQKGLGAEKFQNEGIRIWEDYKRLFIGRNEKCLGDISNDYLYYYEISIKNIKEYLGNDTKIIIILRNPIDRAYSNYLHAFREGWEDSSFEEALQKEEERIKNGWAWPYHYVRAGMYYEQVKAYVENFRNIRIYLYEDLKNLDNMLNNIYAFLEIKTVNVDLSKKYNVSGIPKNKLLHTILINDNILKRILRALIPKSIGRAIIYKIRDKNLKKISMNIETKRYLVDIYKDNIDELEKLIKRDLSSWKNI